MGIAGNPRPAGDGSIGQLLAVMVEVADNRIATEIAIGEVGSIAVTDEPYGLRSQARIVGSCRCMVLHISVELAAGEPGTVRNPIGNEPVVEKLVLGRQRVKVDKAQVLSIRLPVKGRIDVLT